MMNQITVGAIGGNSIKNQVNHKYTVVASSA